ncbi:MAG: methionyl-tRNA formyltransferase [Limnohabitans sp.]|nr:methionyl-tRNA formyltransferase [Limnohabitans sp.]
MRIIFAGTPAFAQQALSALHQAGHEIALVLTQPDRPAGRGMKPQASAVKQWAIDHHLNISQPRSLRLDGGFASDAQQAQQLIAQTHADVMVVAAYGLILPLWVLQSMHLGCLNIHASLLPRWRGAAPIHRAIEADDTQTGVCIMQMDEGLDTGAVLLQRTHPIGPDTTTHQLHNELAQLGAQCMVNVLSDFKSYTPVAQSADGVTYAKKIDKKEAVLDWSQHAQVLARRLRAFDPFPGGLTYLNNEPLKIWSAKVHSNSLQHLSPGTVLHVSSEGIDVACGEGVLRITSLQRTGGKRLSVVQFIQGFEGLACAVLQMAPLK